MKSNFIMIFLVLCAKLCYSQLVFTEIDYVTVDSISNIVIGDPDNNGKQDIFYIMHNQNDIIKLANNTNTFSSSTYLPAESPKLLSLINLNYNTDDVVFTQKDSSGIYSHYGKDDNNAERKQGPVIGKDDLKNLKTIASIKNDLLTNPPKFINLHAFATGNVVHYWGSTSSSFDIISATKLTTLQYAFNIKKIQGFHKSNTLSEYYYLDNTFNYIRRVTFTWDNPYNPVVSGSLFLFAEFTKLEDILIYNEDQSNFLLALDPAEKNIIKYNLTFGGQKTVTPINFTAPSKMLRGKINDDRIDDLLIIDGNKIYISTDFSRAEFVLLKDEDKPIKDIIVHDFNNDGYDDIIYTKKNTTGIHYLKNDIKTSTIENALSKILANTLVQDIVYFNEEVLVKSIIDLTGKPVLIEKETPTTEVNISNLATGIYFIQYTYRGKLYFEKIYKN